MKFLLFSAISLLLIASQAEALNLFDKCIDSLSALYFNPGLNECLPIQKLTSFSLDSITPKYINDMTAMICSRPACSQSTLSLLQETAENCLGSDPATRRLIQDAVSLYPSFREGTCQRAPPGPGQTTQGALCATIIAEGMAKQGQYSFDISKFTSEEGYKAYLNSIPLEVFCSDCHKVTTAPVMKYIQENQSSLGPETQMWARVTEADFKAKYQPTTAPSGTTPPTGTPSGSTTTPQNQMSQAIPKVAVDSRSVAIWAIGVVAWVATLVPL
ncbi:hypothetical protein BGW38_009829 [Lunasporangiospora selenospora]|uniref:Uncharacterized protein n=1 Tax=Lunasporangiospora selenospora TaxID=979761 RepID=A0A9P6KG02_9FUNG|nr:hypothetical protein BGW38_009829 [Lunasporangiospora selenospora]